MVALIVALSALLGVTAELMLMVLGFILAVQLAANMALALLGNQQSNASANRHKP
jgi:UPF0716 family protein affecting phage T7 exclusion